MKRSYTIEDMRKSAEKRGGKCLSPDYINARTPLLWECANGHRWSAEPRSIIGGSWCRRCFFETRAAELRLDLTALRHLAEERGGRSLAETYSNVDTKVPWECAFGHRWSATVIDVKRGRWCPECSSGQGERICREFFERLFCASFPSRRPPWLLNSRGNRMELDGFSERLQLAFEHQGEQHFSARTHYVKTATNLERRIQDDRRKTELCEVNGIRLICVPEIGGRLPVTEVRNFILRECERLGVDVPHPDDATFDDVLRAALTTNQDALKLESLRRTAHTRGGKCLSKTYRGTWEDLQWECCTGHRWQATPNNIKQGTWCPVCAGTQRKTLADMDSLAAAKGGRCLSSVYSSNRGKLLWECREGHRWKATPGNVSQGKWCPICGIRKRSKGRRSAISDMQEIAERRGGTCLSKRYTNAKTKLLWQCAEGHSWKATPSDVKQGRWCPECGRARAQRKRALTIEEMHELARQRGGLCLSEVYINVKTHLDWQCARGHRWKAIPESVRRGSWCPICARRRA